MRGLVLAAILVSGAASAANIPITAFPPRGTIQSTDMVPIQASGSSTTSQTTAANLQTYNLTGLFNGTWTIPAYPIINTAIDGVTVYISKSEFLGSNVDPYHGNVAMGSLVLNPTTHHSDTLCTDPTIPSCGDETAFGSEVLTKDVNGHDNTGMGTSALYNLISGNNNTFVGSAAGTNLIDSGGDTGIGVSACQNIRHTTAPVTCIGLSALQGTLTTTTGYTTAVGSDALFSATGTVWAGAFGDSAAYAALTANYSLAVGPASCHNVTSLVNSTCIGAFSSPASGSLSNVLWIGGPSSPTAPIIYGNTLTNVLGINTTTLISGAALTLGGGGLAVPASQVVQWNSDAGISRSAAGTLLVGNGTNGDASGYLAMTKVGIAGNANLTSSSTGVVSVGTGGTAGTGGSVNLTNLGASGTVTAAGLISGNGGLAVAAGQVVQWNSDAGISRSAAGTLLVGNGTNGNSSGTLTMSKLGLSGNANLTSSSTGVVSVGTGGTVGTGGSVVAQNISTVAQVYPGTGSASQSAGGLLAGTGNPGASVGNNGDFYFRTDCTHGTSNCTWHKEGGTWQDLN